MPASQKKSFLFILLFLYLIVFYPVFAQAQDDHRGLEVVAAPIAGSELVGQQYAVFIAIDRYGEWPPLKNAVSDAERIRSVLQQRYYISQTYTLYNEEATKEKVMKLFEDLSRELHTEDSLFVFYAGHGVMDPLTNIGSWILQDAGTNRYEQKGWLDNPKIRSLLNKVRSKHVLLVSDSCFSGDILNVERGNQIEITNDYFKKAYARRSRQVLTSGASETVPDESIFTRSLIRLLEENNKPYLDPLMLFNEIRLTQDLKTSPLLGTLKDTDTQEGGSFIFFLKQAQPQKFKIFYNPNGAMSGIAPNDVNEYPSGSFAQLRGQGSLAKSGYEFTGWNTKPDGTGAQYAVGSIISVKDSDIILYARWNPINEYRITYDANGATGGTPPIDSSLYTFNARAKVLSPFSLVKDGYEFAGWNTKADGTGKYYNPGDEIAMIWMDTTLYAQWKQKVAIKSQTGWIDFSDVPLHTDIYLDGSYLTSSSGYVTSNFKVVEAGNHKIELIYRYSDAMRRSFYEVLKVSANGISKPLGSLRELADYLEEEKKAAEEYQSKSRARNTNALFSLLSFGAGFICYFTGQSAYHNYKSATDPSQISSYRSQAELFSGATVASFALGAIFTIQIPFTKLPPKPETLGLSLDAYIQDLDSTISSIRSSL